MKKTMLLFIGAGLLLATPSCKKGENDPMSLKSRKARLAGDWTLTKLEGTTSDKDNNGTTTKTYTYDGSNLSVTTATSSSSSTSTSAYVFNMSFDKKGTFTSDEKYTYTNGDYDQTVSEGQWAFIGKNKEAGLKNKEALILSSTKITDSFSYSGVFGSGSGSDTESISGDYAFGQSSSQTLILDKLSSKELVIKNNYTSTDATNTLSYDLTYTFEKK